ncbi:MAG: flavodoxin-dependent (E)-4-hydroxy-3-methylbut-2-enyl-diphosphate synthase [Solobacterium sp.]|nr:flavodoxin-dependent (E)-4-hydroxy-3-methylbut-2-enyl-diphosphate synthase [Solobacterium sp.]
MMKRTETRPIFVGGVQIGHQEKCILQSMTNIPAKNVKEAVKQINSLAENGCEIVRTAVLDEEDAKAIAEIKKKTSVPLVADIHFNHRLALISLAGGVDAIRINPGNIGSKEHTAEVVNMCKEKHVPIRIGINAGSLERQFLQEYGGPCAEAMIASAKRHTDILEELDFRDICLSFKSSNVKLTIDAYRAAAQTFEYPLHLGVTEAGGFAESAVKSSAALGVLLNEGIGDTIRVSVSGDPNDELPIAKQLLRCFDLIDGVPDLIACPTCGRIQYDMMPVVREMEDYLQHVHANITVAVMGCPVNGMQEASRADVGVAGGYEIGMLFRKGKLIRKVPQAELTAALKAEIEEIISEQQ